jgi:transcriptional antiterminator NusG
VDAPAETPRSSLLQLMSPPMRLRKTTKEEDPAVALKKELRLKPGEWYVIHSYAGYENKVKANLETRVQNLDVGDYIFQVEVPTEEVTEIKNGQRKQVNRKVLPGYILVRMELNDESWGAVRNTPASPASSVRRRGRRRCRSTTW